MIQLTIHVDLLPNKLNEFNQSWESFIQHIKNNESLASCQKNCIDITACEIVLECRTQKQMDFFMQTEWYEFLMGAIQTLGDKSETKQIQVNGE